MNKQRKRVTIRLKHPNPLFEKWLKEWKEDAKQKESKMQHCFGQALRSLQKYPLPLDRGRDCKILNGFGDRLCQMLDNKLDEYNKSQSGLGKALEYTSDNIMPVVKRKSDIATNTSLNLKRNKKEYIPAYRSGGYAILIALYECNVFESNNEVNKSNIILRAQNLCDKSFTKADPGTFYTAWSSMRTLLDKALVLKKSNPPKYSLTASGSEIAKKLYEAKLTELEEIQVIEHKVSEDIVKNKVTSGGIHTEVTTDKCAGSGDCSNSQESDGRKALVTDFETVLFAPYTFEVILLVDKQETCGSKEKIHNDPILSELTQLNVPADVKHLKVGDYTWICRNKTTNFELVLPYVVERKRMDDFGSSIKDGRYHEQKFRLKQCGIQNVIYLVESYGDNTHTGLPLSTLHQAATNTLLQDDFRVKFSEGIRGTAQYLNSMTKILKENYESKTLMSCPKANLEKSTINDDLIPLMTFEEFNQSGSKYKNFTASEMFIKNLVQLKGLSLDKALAIVDKYPTVGLFKRSCDEDIENVEKTLTNIYFSKKKRIGPVISATLCKYYTFKDFK